MPSSAKEATAAAAAANQSTTPSMSSKALALVVASKTNKNVASENKRVAAKTREKDDIPNLAGNFQDRDEIKLNISCQNVTSNANIQVPEASIGKAGKNKNISTFCVVYSTASEDVLITRSTDAGTGEGRDETESLDETSRNGPLRLPSGCTELGLANSTNSSHEATVTTTFSIYRMKDIVVAIYQKLADSSDISQQHLLGYARFSLHKLVCSSEQKDYELENGGRITISAAPTDSKGKNLRFRFAGKGLGASRSLKVQPNMFDHNPFLAVSYLREEADVNEKSSRAAKDAKKGGKWEVLWKSNVVRGSIDPHFNYGQIPTYRLSGDTPMCITCLNYDDKGNNHNVIGQARTTYHELLRAAGFALRHNKITTGYVGIEHMDMTLVPTLSHYLSQGSLGLDFMVAVDFTKSNMQVQENDYQDPRSFLHRIRRSGKMNGYQLSLCSIGRIFEELNSKKTMHIWGFGAEVDGALRHRFRMGSEGGRVRGVEGLLDAYNQTATSNISMSEPKDIRKTLYTAIARAEMNASTTLSYSVLLVLVSEGFLHELRETLEQICEASYTPLSIIFVGIGVGNFSDFQDMVEEQKVSPSGKEFMRECISFIQLEKHRSDISKLLKVTLQNIPKQIVQYHMSKQISPDRDELRSDDDQQDTDADLCSSGHPHLLADCECVDMTEVSAYVSPCSSMDEADGDDGREEDQRGLSYFAESESMVESMT